MDKVREMWSPALPAIPESELVEVRGAAAEEYGDLCCCFWLFRYLHEVKSPDAALMGDYCFGRFSHHLAGIDSVSLTNEFSCWLQGDILNKKTMEEFLGFVSRIPEIVANGN